VSDAAASATPADGLAALLAGETVGWEAMGLSPAGFLAFCEDENAIGLVHRQLSRPPASAGWPRDVLESIARAAQAEAARELLRQRETARVLDALATRGVQSVLFKGTALAYGVYDSPSFRPRGDTDLLIRREDVEPAREALAALAYQAPLYCDGDVLFCQFELAREDHFGVIHAFDIHWKISTQALFADLLSYDELTAQAVAVPALGPHARAASPPHALLIACVHAAMHHRNVERIIWLYDLHLLAARLGPADWDRFVALACDRRMGAIAAHALTRARTRLRTPLPDSAIEALAAGSAADPSAAYLDPDRHWHDELISNLRGMGRPADRWRLLREVLLPSPAYMRRAYGMESGVLGTLLLPLLYLHRITRGGLRVLAGRK
jgi:hypothetical protein